MNFELTEEQNLIRDMVRSFAETEIYEGTSEIQRIIIGSALTR